MSDLGVPIYNKINNLSTYTNILYLENITAAPSGWVAEVNGGGTITYKVGGVELYAPKAAGDYARIYTNTGYFYMLYSDSIISFELKVGNNPTTFHETNSIFGLKVGGAVATMTDQNICALGISADKWIWRTDSAGTDEDTDIDTTILAGVGAGEVICHLIEFYFSASNIKLYIDAAYVATHTTIPANGLFSLNFVVASSNTLASSFMVFNKIKYAKKNTNYEVK